KYTLRYFFQAFADSRLAYPEDVRANTGRIVSGWEAEEGQFPYQLSLRMVNNEAAVFACGATLIHNEWALTAAHCTAMRITIVVRVGVTQTTRPALIFETTEYYNHPLYIEELPFVQQNDIGVIKFPRPVEYSDVIKPIRLQSSADKDKNYDGLILLATGWGRNWTNGVSPENMNWVYLTGVANQDCRAAFGGSSTIVASTICAGFYNVTSQSTCQGDSGGGLTVVDEDGIVSQVGVSSFVSSSGCHTPIPAGFIRPGHYHDWFYEVTGINFDWVPGQEEDSESSESSESESSESESSESESDEDEDESNEDEDGDNEDGDNEDGDNEDGDNEDGDNEDGDNEDGDNEDGDNEDGDNEDGDNGNGEEEEAFGLRM
ncbi:collagenase-like, partial [Colias croceus]|uniref:collagenase-like n=1 Tax=Colias crocea TaxID=72248 RepID=UPI001E27BD58